MLFFNGNVTAILIHYFGTANINYSIHSRKVVDHAISFRIRYEIEQLLSFSMSILKSIGYPLGLLLQILTVIYLVRGNSYYSRSARNWFLIVLGADIGSTLYRLYELMTVDFNVTNPFINSASIKGYFGQTFLALMWGLRRMEDAFIQNVFCKVFFIILYFPIYLSPIALTINSMIRCYCVKHPLRIRVERALMAFAVVLSLIISICIGTLIIFGMSNSNPATTILGDKIFYGDCPIPRLNIININVQALFMMYVFMLAIIIIICALNILSAIIIIKILFRNKNRMPNDSADSSAEIRVTAIILGMNVTLFVCFLGSRVMVIIGSKLDIIYHPVAYVVLERVSTYLFNIPYYTNSLFIAGFNRKFYAFFLPCLARRESMVTTVPATSMKTLEETKIG